MTRVIRCPYDGAPLGEVADTDLAGLDAAIRAAAAVRPMRPHRRAELLLRLAALLRRDAAEFARLIALETGKVMRDALVEVDRATATLEASAQVARELTGEVIPMEGFPSGAGRMAITVREPLGVIGAITPFNFPLNLTLHKLGPALATGNSVVHKPSEATPLSALRLAQLTAEAEAPAGAYNVVPGDETIGRALVTDPRVAMITFTGSVPVGKEIRAAAGLKRVTLELGGNAAVLLEPDADLDVAVARAVVGGYALAGQSCISVQRVYAHRSIYAEFVERFTADVRELVVGHPLDPATQVASLISEEAARRVEEWIAEAVEAGAQLLTGGVRTGSVITPAVLTGVPEGVRLSCEEVFGPVVAIYPYDDLDQAIAAANRTRYGLQAGIFTRDLERAFWAAGRLQFGGVMINDIPTFRADHMPYGGVKESGLGREGPRYAAEEMTERKLICWRIPSTSSAIQAVTEPRP